MNVHISYKGNHKPSDLEQEINPQIQKLGKRLQVFRPDLVHLRVGLDQKDPREGFNVSLDLRLPSGDIAAQETGTSAEGAIRKAFDDLIEQVAKHKDHLRAQHKWVRRRRVGRTRPQPQVPFEDTVAAVHPEAISDEDVNSWLNVNLYRLMRFVDREIRYREANGQLQPEQLTRTEVVDETVARALGDGAGDMEKPEKVALETWMFALARRALDDLSRSTERDGDVSLEHSMRQTDVSASDEDRLQYFQPDETPREQDNIMDRGAPTPEQIAASDEVIAMVDVALRGGKPEDREAFILFAIEGFTVDEISVITGRTQEQIRESVKRAREHVKKQAPVNDVFKDRLLQSTKIA
jgi:RNA polymerase sigma factor (sigma-70 family)